MSYNPFETVREQVDTSPPAAGEVKCTTCYMCACRCGIRVHLKDGRVRYIEGNPDHPVNHGVLCAKGSAGIMQHYSPARLTKPLLRVGERGAGEFREIEWDEALDLAASWLGEVRATDPRKLAFFTGRDQSQSLTGWWAAQFGTPNFAAHGGFCSVNMAAAGLYTIGSSFWEFGEPDWEHTRYFMMFGVAEDHDSNPIKIGLGALKSKGCAKFVSVNPVQTGYSAIADEWIGIRPGTDGLFVAALIHELLRAEKIDWDYLARYTNAHWLVIRNPGAADDGLFARDAQGRPLCLDGKTRTLVPAENVEARPVLAGEAVLGDGRKAVPAFQLMALRFLDEAYSPAAVEGPTGVDAATIRRLAAEIARAAFDSEVVLEVPWTDWAGRRHDRMIGRPVAMHAMRGISAHANGFHTCRIIHLLQMLLGSIDVPGGFRHKPPFPRPCPPNLRPAGRDPQPMTPLPGVPLGFPQGPEDLLIDDDGRPVRIDKAFSWDFPLALHGLMHTVIHNAWAGDPYPVDVLFLYMANMAWNSSMNVPATLHYLTDRDEAGHYRIPRVIYSDAFHSETVAYADLVLPDTTYLERWDCISLLDRPICNADGPADAIRHPVVDPDRDVRPFQDVLLDLGVRLGLPGMTGEDGSARFPGGYADYMVNHERGPGIGPLAGWRGTDGSAHGRGAPNPEQLDRYIENGGFWREELPVTARYFKHANRAYLDYAQGMGWISTADPIVLQIYSEPLQRFRLAAQGHGPVQPPEQQRERIATYFDPLPLWYPPADTDSGGSFGLHAVTQRPMHMYHSWGGQNAWLRQITARNCLFVHPDTAAAAGVGDGERIWIISAHGRVAASVRLMSGVEKGTVWTWNAIGKRRGTWGLAANAPEATHGFLLNHIIADLLPEQADGMRYANADPVTGQAAWYDLKVRIEPRAEEVAGDAAPPAALPSLPNPPERPAVMRFGQEFRTPGQGRDGGDHLEWIGNRESHAGAGTGVRPGHGNRTRCIGDDKA